MRPMIVSLVALAVAFSIAVPSAGAQFNAGFLGGPVNQGVPYVFTCGLTSAMPFSQGAYFLQAFNASTLARTDTEAMAIAFPLSESTGPGSLRVPGPAIAQTASESIFATRSYFFNDVLAG